MLYNLVQHSHNYTKATMMGLVLNVKQVYVTISQNSALKKL